MKTRSSTPITCTMKGIGFGALFGLVSGPYLEEYYPFQEMLSSESGPRFHTVYYNGKRFKLPTLKNVFHQKIKRYHKPWSGYTSNSSPERVSGFVYHQCEVCSAYADEVEAVPSYHLSDFLSEAVRAVYPRFKSETNLLNFIYELREVKTLIPSVKNIRRALSSMRDIAQRLSDASKVVSEAILNLNYGIQPLISDIFNIMTDINSFKMKLNDFCKRAGKPQVRHFKKELNTEDIVGPIKSYPGGEEYWTESSLIKATLNFTLYYGYTIVGLPDTSAIPKIDASLLARFHGARTGALPAAFWNALPFSFLVDYVVKVGDWLEQLDLGALDITFTPLQACYSLKSHKRTTYNMRMGAGAKNEGSGQKYFNIDDQNYSRIRIDDLSLLSLYIDPVPSVDSFDSREQVLVFNLINANRH